MTGRLIAQCVTVSGQKICGKAVGFDGRPIETPAGVLNQLMPFLYGISMVILLFVFIWAGFDMVLSRGDAGKIKSAKAKITSGIIGTILLAVAYLITRLVSQMFGIGQDIF